MGPSLCANSWRDFIPIIHLLFDSSVNWKPKSVIIARKHLQNYPIAPSVAMCAIVAIRANTPIGKYTNMSANSWLQIQSFSILEKESNENVYFVSNNVPATPPAAPAANPFF